MRKGNGLIGNHSFPSRRRLTEVPGVENVYEIDRAEGDIAETGNAFDADNMNDLEG